MVYISFEVATLPVCVPLTKGMFRIAIVWNFKGRKYSTRGVAQLVSGLSGHGSSKRFLIDSAFASTFLQSR